VQQSKIEKITFSGGLYQAAMYISSVFFPVMGFFSLKLQKFVSGRKDWRSILSQKMSALGPEGQHLPLIHFHCASVGEFEQARPLIEKLHSSLPGHRILLTFFSPSGFELRKNYAFADLVFYLPVDTKQNMRDFLNLVNPSMVVIVKYEFWPNFLFECYNRNIPVISVSVVFRAGQFYFRRHGNFFLNALRTIEHFFVQDSASLEILAGAGINQATIAGDTRFDRVISVRDQGAPVAEAVDFVENNPAMVIGSAWPEDMKVLGPVIQKFAGRMKFIVVPHEVDSDSLDSICRYLPDFVKFSEWDGNKERRVMLVDKIGMLSRLYACGKIAWVGGAYGKGLHNILEAAVYGMPVFFGNRNYTKFREALELIEMGAAFPVSSADELSSYLEELLNDSAQLEKLSGIARDYVFQNRGATEKIMNYLSQKLMR
jgi:3-deoxy-D-manno-octulosonic-acid transferase